MSAVTAILVPREFSGASHAALRYACCVADRLQACLYLLHVVEPPPVPSGYMEVATKYAGSLMRRTVPGFGVAATEVQKRRCFEVRQI